MSRPQLGPLIIGGELDAARRRLAEAERIDGLGQGGPWLAGVWETRAALRRAEGDEAQARAFFREAADLFASAGRPLDETRCRPQAIEVLASRS